MDTDLKELIELLDSDKEAWSENYKLADDDLKFYDGEGQWDERAAEQWRNAGLTAIVNNRIPSFCHQIINDIRQNTPAMKALPADSFSDIETAEVMQDLFRNIEYISQADMAYDTAAEFAVKCGIGFISLDHDYVAPDSMDQHVLIREETNPLAIFLDGDSIKSDGSDANHAWRLDKMSARAFKKKYPKAKAESIDAKYMLENAKCFHDGDDVVVAELFRLKTIEAEVVQLSNGLVVWADQLGNMSGDFEVVNSRMSERKQCYRYRMTGAEILEENEFPSSYVPIVPVYGEIHRFENKRRFYSLFRHAKDAQRMVNQWSSRENEALAKAPKSPYIAAEGQLEGYESQWRNPDGKMVLQYKPVTLNGNLIGAPQRVEPPPISPGIVNARLTAVDDMKAIMGIFDPSLGAQSNEKSGKAIMARQRQTDLGSFHFNDNLSRAITQVARISMDMCQRLIDTPRIIRTLKEDGSFAQVAVNGQPTDFQQEFDRIYDIRTGRYDVMVTTGPSYATKRQEAAEALIQLSQGNPVIGQAAPDLLVQSLDIPNADVLAKRLKKVIPPNLIEGEDDENDAEAQLQQAKAMLQQADVALQNMQAQIEELGKALQEAQSDDIANKAKMAEVEIKAAELQLKRDELEFEMRKAAQELELKAAELNIDAAKAEADIRVKEVEAASQVEITKAQTDAQIAQAQIAGGGEYIPPYVLEHMESMRAQDQQAANAQIAVAQSLTALAATLENIGKPKQVVRDETGRIAGIV